MKVLIILCWHPTKEKPQYCKWILPHIKAAKLTGNDIRVIHLEVSSDKSKDGMIEEVSDNHFHSSIYISDFEQKRNILCYGLCLFKYSSRIKYIYKNLPSNWGKPDLIHAHVSLPAGFAASELSKSLNIPAIVSEHYSGFESDMRFFWRVRFFINSMLKNIVLLTAVSPGFLERIKSAKLSHFKNLKLLANPIDTGLFSGNRVKSDKSIIRLVTVGTTSSIKGLDLLFSALESLENKEYEWHLDLIGSMEHNSVFKQFMDNDYIRSRTTLHGRLEQSCMAEIYLESDLYIVSSRSETANVSMLEAMSCGVPVLSTRCGGPETLLDKKSSILVDSHSVEAIYYGLIKFYESQVNFDRKRASRYVDDNYSLATISNRLDNIYKKCVYEYKNK
ncbi:glycosyltransferase family 4 protein [uncultured Vibrio sp.]|uniref:glycosyltransferase family 4 protein n=1 Tax=uncultured Vibrio sp. TaxID=114054 RepID=UPI0025EFFA53|nr:glycosyltransferase family 4 protein [uncultured Vibrio sp.]